MTYSRFSSAVGCHYNPDYLDALSDDDLASVINGLDFYDADLLRELVWRADRIKDGLFKAYVDAEEWDDAIPIIKRAAEVLGIKIDL